MAANYFNINHLLLLLGLILFLNACQEDSINEPPQILSMSIEGIPQQSINVDQQQRVITIVLPATLPSFELLPDFTLSRQAHLPPYWTNDKRTISFTKYCPCWTDSDGSIAGLKMVTRVDNQRQTTYYTIKFQSGGPLRIKPLPTPIIYEAKGADYNIVVPVENYYGSSFVEAIAVTRTGSAVPDWLGGGFCFEQCGGRLNELVIPLAGYLEGGIEATPRVSSLKPGLYDLDLGLIDGTRVHATGAILVK